MGIENELIVDELVPKIYSPIYSNAFNRSKSNAFNNYSKRRRGIGLSNNLMLADHQRRHYNDDTENVYPEKMEETYVSSLKDPHMVALQNGTKVTPYNKSVI